MLESASTEITYQKKHAAVACRHRRPDESEHETVGAGCTGGGAKSEPRVSTTTDAEHEFCAYGIEILFPF